MSNEIPMPGFGTEEHAKEQAKPGKAFDPVAAAAPTASDGGKIKSDAKAKPGDADDLFEDVDAGRRGQIIILYGEGGSGKTTLACSLPGKTAVVDLENSLPLLAPTLDQLGLSGNVKKIKKPVKDFKALVDLLNMDVYGKFDNLIVDSLSVAQDYAKTHTYAHSPTKAKTKATCLDDYEYSSGPMYVYRWFIPNFWAAIEKHADAGRNVVIIAHDVYETIPNGDGTEYKQYQFDGLTMKSGKDSIRHFMKYNADHVLFLKADIMGDKKKNAIGGNTYTLYAAPLPYIMAKSRTQHDPTFTIVHGEVFDWTQIIK